MLLKVSVLITLEKFGFDIFYWKLPNIKEKKKTNFSMKNNIFPWKWPVFNDKWPFFQWKTTNFIKKSVMFQCKTTSFQSNTRCLLKIYRYLVPRFWLPRLIRYHQLLMNLYLQSRSVAVKVEVEYAQLKVHVRDPMLSTAF